MYADSIDFANSKSDSYTASNSSVMDELNSYFKSYIAGHSGNNMTVDEAADEIFKGAGFDDAMDMINRDRPGRRMQSSSSSSSSSSSDDENEFNRLDNGPEQNLLDVEILDQHIDKAGITGGADATRAIENMAGGNRNGDIYDVDDEFDRANETDSTSAFANAMLGGSSKKPRINTSGPVRGYSGVTSEIRVRGNRVTERGRNGSNYLTEDGYIDAQSMLGGGDSDDQENNHHEDDDYEKRGDNDANGTPVEQSPATEDSEEKQLPTVPSKDKTMDESDDDYEIESAEYDSESDDTDPTDQNSSYQSNMASEIDHVLSQLRNKTARTLPGGTVNIRKKVVLTDMYPYILRS